MVLTNSAVLAGRGYLAFVDVGLAVGACPARGALAGVGGWGAWGGCAEAGVEAGIGGADVDDCLAGGARVARETLTGVSDSCESLISSVCLGHVLWFCNFVFQAESTKKDLIIRGVASIPFIKISY